MKAIIGWVHGRLTTLFIQIFFEASVGKAIKHCCGSPVSTAGSHPSTGINAIEHFFTFYFLLSYKYTSWLNQYSISPGLNKIANTSN